MKRPEIYVSSPMTKEDQVNACLAVSDQVMDTLVKAMKEKPPVHGDKIIITFDFRFLDAKS